MQLVKHTRSCWLLLAGGHLTRRLFGGSEGGNLSMRQYEPFLVRTIQHVIVGLALCTVCRVRRWQFIAVLF